MKDREIIQEASGRGSAGKTAENAASDRHSGRIRDIQKILRLRLLDDVFMKEILRDNIPAVQIIVRTLLRRKDITVTDVKIQDEFSNLVGHSVRVDVLARDSQGRIYNIEIQRASDGAGAKRARYHLGAVDWHTLPPGADYEELPETWIIFITEKDIFGKNFPVYTVERMVMETGEPFGDAGHILYANGAYSGDDDIGMLMEDFRETDPKKMHHPPLAERVSYYKNTEGGLEVMKRVADLIREECEEAREEGLREGLREGSEAARRSTRADIVANLLLSFSEEELLYDRRFRGLRITREEIDNAREQAADSELFGETFQ